MDVTAPASRFFDGRQAQGHAVTLAIENGIVRIRSADGGVATDWPLGRLVAQSTHDGAVSFRIGRGPARLVTGDPALLQALRARTGRLRRWPRRQSGWGMALATGAALAVAGVLLVAAAPGLLAPLVPPSWEASWGSSTQALVLRQHRQCRGADGQRALDRLAARLAAAGGIGAPVRLAVADDALVNAFTLPGNRVVLMRGLIASSADGNELAGVLAHELGHVAHHDPARQLLRQLGLHAVAAAFGWSGLDAGGMAATLLGLSYGRAAESQADSFAIATLRRAGLRADGLGRFFTRMEADGAPGLGFLSDHPPTAERRERARQPADGDPAFTDAEWQAIRTMCKA